MDRPATVYEYIRLAPQEFQPVLNQIRRLIRETAPAADERISYGMPFYDYQGRLVYFALQKHHLGLYIPPPIIADFADELKNYTTTKSAVHFSLSKPLPVNLIKKLITARMDWNSNH